MNVRTSFLCALASSALLGASSAWADLVEVAPIHTGSLFDQDPFDGLGDAIDETQGLTVGLNSQILDLRGVVEFDLSTVHRRRHILSATLEITPLGWSLPSTSVSMVPVQLYAFAGGPALQLDDFNRGTFVDVFNGLGPFNVPLSIDVTDTVRRWGQRRYLGFTLRTNVHGAFLTNGSPAIGSPPKLVINYE